MMEAEYGIGIKNRFAFLCKDADNEDDERPEVSAKIMPAKPSAEKKIPLPPSKNTGGKPENKEKVGQVQNRTTPNPKERVPKGRNQQVLPEERKGPRENGRFAAERQESRQGSGTRGFRRDGPPNRRNYRARHPEENKEGQNETDEKAVADSNRKDAEDTTEAPTVGDVDKADADDVQEDENETPKAEEKTLTLAEWKALQAPREKPVFNIRKPGEGEVVSKLGKLVLKKKEEDIGNQDEEYETDDVYYPQRAGKMKLISDVGFTTGYQKRRGGRFGNPGRGGGGGDGHGREAYLKSETNNMADKPRGRPRFGPRGGHQRPAQVPRIDDASDFPTLG